jgi:glycosyltransferase involved in cell wall biosynthesis
MLQPHSRVANILISSAHINGVGGVQLVLRNLVTGLRNSGRRVAFAYQTALPSFSLEQTTNSLGCRAFGCAMPALVRNSAVLSVCAFLMYLPIALFHLSRVLRRERIDLINCHFLDPYFVHLVIAARVVGVPVLVSVHGADIDAYADAPALQRFYCRLIMRGATRVIACSEALARHTLAAFPMLGDRVTCVYNGLDLAQPQTPQPIGLPHPFVLSVCRHVRKKGIDVLLRAFARIAGELPDTSLVLVGGGPLLDEHKRLAAELGIETRVLFVGDVPHDRVGAYFDACTLFVLASRAEPFGLVILEAARARTGIIATRVDGVAEILTDGMDAMLVEPDDPEALADQIAYLLHNAALAEQLGVQAYRTLITRFLWNDRIHDYIEVFQEAADRLRSTESKRGWRLAALRPGRVHKSDKRWSPR